MKWYQMKEQSAGIKRLLFLYHIHKYFGRKPVEFITFWVTLCTFVAANDVRRCSKEYLLTVGLKPTLFNQFRHFLSYSDSLIDKMEAFINKFDYNKVFFAESNKEKMFFDDIALGKGVFFICSHLGNVDVLRSLLNKDEIGKNVHVNVFLSESQCKIFRSFINKIAGKQNVTTYPVENIGINTPIEIKEKLDKGELVFLAGDRVAESGSQPFETKFLGRKVEFPLGTFKFAKIMDVPVYFIAAVKEKDGKYNIYLEKSPTRLRDMQSSYVAFLENLTQKYPLQFYHFYNMFLDEVEKHD